jgi:hypothetical protein
MLVSDALALTPMMCLTFNICRCRARLKMEGSCGTACLLLFLLVLLPISAAQQQQQQTPPSSSTSTEEPGTASSSSGSPGTISVRGPSQPQGWLLQRLQRVQQPTTTANSSGGDNSTDGSPDDDSTVDFTSTANDLTQQAVNRGTAQAAALAAQTAQTAQSPTDTINSSSSSSSSNASTGLAALQLQEVQQLSERGSENASTATGNSSSDDQNGDGLQVILQGIQQQWSANRNQQQQQQDDNGNNSEPDAGQQFVAGLDTMAAKYPSLSGFARLARNSSALVVSLLCASSA